MLREENKKASKRTHRSQIRIADLNPTWNLYIDIIDPTYSPTNTKKNTDDHDRSNNNGNNTDDI